MSNQEPLNEEEGDRVKAAINKIINALDHHNMIPNDKLEFELGAAHKVDVFHEGKFKFERKTWYKDGEELMVIVNVIDEDDTATPKEKRLMAFQYFAKTLEIEDLNELLKQSEEDEDYDCAVIIRDELLARKGEVYNP